MKLVSLITLGLITVAAAQPRREDLARIELISPAQLELLDQRGVTINDVRSDHCLVEAQPEKLLELSRDGFLVTVLKEDISGEYYRNYLAGLSDGRYLTYQEFVDTMHLIAVNNPGLCRLETLATTTSTGRKVLALLISDNPQANEPEPAIIWDANTHGDEKIGWAVAFEFIKYLLNNYGVLPEVTELVNSRETWIVPMFNPDGYVNSSRYNGRNVDMNRNWGWMWGYESAPGSSVMSENEVTGLVELLWRYPISIWVSYHAGTEAISYPWSYTDYDTIPENRAIDWLSAGYSQRGNGYEYGQGSVIMYLINGSSKDLGYGAMGAMSWSIEVHYSKTPPASEIDPTFLRNREAMMFFSHQAGHGINGTVTDSFTGRPLHAQIWLQPKNWPSFTDAVNGDYHRFALPGTYGLTVRCPGYEDKVLSGIVVPSGGDSSVTVDVQLRPNPSLPGFGFRLVACSAVTISSNRTYPVRALGMHDGTAFQLDNNHWIILDMDQPIRNGPGNDFSVYRSSGTATAAVMAANNWKGPWTTVGTANSAQTDFDLGAVGLDSARYVKLKASGVFQLDAVEAVLVTGLESPRPAAHPRPQDYHLAVVPGIVREQATIISDPAPVQDLPLGLYDVQGRRLKALVLPAGQARLAFQPGLAPGIYYVRSEEGLVGSRFIISRP